MGNEDLGNHHLRLGDYASAFKFYNKMREYCTTNKHLIELQIKLMYVAILQGNWSGVIPYRVKLSGLGIREEDRVAKFDPIMNASVGLAHMNMGKYRDAAMVFINVNPSYVTLDDQAGVRFQREVMTPNDIATYGGLCALASMDSSELKKYVLENQPFRQFLELEPHLRRAIGMYCSSKFAACLAVLNSYSADYKLDVYLQKHFGPIYQQIRTKAMVHWLSAFSAITFDEIEKAFPAEKSGGSEQSRLEDELEKLIMAGKLDARLDLVDRVSELILFEEFKLTCLASCFDNNRSQIGCHRTHFGNGEHTRT